MTVEDLIQGFMAALSAGLLTALAILAAPVARCLLSRLRRVL